MTKGTMNSPNISRFRVEGLFGRRNVDLALSDNRLIIVGENGSGKSTVVNMLYYFVTAQWDRLRKMRFTKLAVDIDRETLEIESSQLGGLDPESDVVNKLIRKLERRGVGSGRARSMIEGILSASPEEHAMHDRLLFYADRYGISPHLFGELVETVEMQEMNVLDEYVLGLSDKIKEKVNCQVLFLPTYRRIERDLQAILPDLSIDRGLRYRHRSRRPQRSERAFVELVEFGMGDVEESFLKTMQQLDREFRADLSRLTGDYLRDIIQSKHLSEEIGHLLAPEAPKIVDDILGRMDDNILPKEEREKLKTLIRTVRDKQDITDKQRVVLHFVSKLIRIHEEQKNREERVTRLVDICNKYLSGKELYFDPRQFRIYLQRREPSAEGGTEQIHPSDLSSGEKQIVSLFTHIYLSDGDGYFVIIDEPELSISVPWQRTFLEDIVDSGYCHGLVAVTHSPFIFENSLDKYARNMSEFVS